MHQLPVHEALVLLKSDRERGLSAEEAARRLERHGPNVLPRVERRSALLRLVLQFHHPLIYVLLVSAAATYAVGEAVEASVILGVVIANAAVGFIQEARAEHALDALAAMMTVEAQVVRDGRRHRVPAKELVPGDIAVIEPGDKVSADMRLLEVDGLQIDESALTGESVPVAKAQSVLAPETVLADRANMAFSGTLVTAGRRLAVVVATGADTELGLIHRPLGETSDLATPLTRKLAHFSRVLTVAVLVLGAATFAIGTRRAASRSADMLVAAVAARRRRDPRGPAGDGDDRARVRRPPHGRAQARSSAGFRAVETLGSTTVICTDKTGTLTENKMTVRRGLVDDAGAGSTPRRSQSRPARDDRDARRSTCLRAGLLCNDGDVRQTDGVLGAVGDPTEAALVVAARKAGLDACRRASSRAADRRRCRSTPTAGTWPRCIAAPTARPSSTSRARWSRCSRCATASWAARRRPDRSTRARRSSRRRRSRRVASACSPSPGVASTR